MRERGIEIQDFGETDENRLLKIEYVKAVSIFYDIMFYHELLKKEAGNAEELVLKFQYVMYIMLPLSHLYKNIKSWTKLNIDNSKLIGYQQSLCDKLEFVNHLRNKIAAHLENEVLDNTIQWGPFIFQEQSKNNKIAQRLVMYRSLLETSINSFQDLKTGKHKIFQCEIDLNIPYDADIFFKFLYNTIDESLDYLNLLISTIDDKIKYFTGLPLDLMKSASETDFKLKPKGR